MLKLSLAMASLTTHFKICGYLEVIRVLGGLVEGVGGKPLPDLDHVRDVHVHIILLIVGDFWGGSVSRNGSRGRGRPLPLLLPRPLREKEVRGRGRHVVDAEGLHVQLNG